MSCAHKLSMQTAIFINVNIMLGSGIFINSTILAKKAGFWGAFCYLAVGLLMLPLIFSISKLVSLHPSGGFYTFGSKEIHPFIGFISTVSYIVGKLASAVIVTQIAVLLAQEAIPLLQGIPSLLLNSLLMVLFIILNMFDIQTNSTIQAYFFGLKIIPITFGILVGLHLFTGNSVSSSYSANIGQLFSALPLVLFATAGFEAACSLSSRIKNASINAPRAIFISYGIVIFATTLFQSMLYGALQCELVHMPDYRYVFPTLLEHLIPCSSTIGNFMSNILHCAIAASALGGSYGIIFSNNWNIYTLAQHNHLFGAHFLTQLNRYHIPWLCVIVEGIIYMAFLFISQGNQIPLQQIGALGPTIAYTFSAIAFWIVTQNNAMYKNYAFIAMLAIGSCMLLIMATLYGLLMYGSFGLYSLVFFILLLTFGAFMFCKKFKETQ